MTFPTAVFDENLVCQYCQTLHIDRPSRRQPRGKGAEELIERCRSRGGKYDCMVAISGGRDSSFAAHYAAKVLGLKVLLCTVDNGFVPEATRQNVESAREALGADLVVVHNERVQRNAGRVINAWRRRPSAAMIPTFCAGCVSGCKGGLERTAREHGIPLVLTGTGEPQLRFGDLYLRTPKTWGGRFPIVLGAACQLISNPSYLASPRCLFEFAREAYYRMSPRYRREERDGVRFVSAFGFIDWDEDLILSTIQSELGWQNPPHSKATWRSDCRLHIVKQYMYQALLGWTKNDMMLSGLIRKGEITRAEALERVKRENELPREMVAETLEELGVDLSEVEVALGAATAPG